MNREACSSPELPQPEQIAVEAADQIAAALQENGGEHREEVIAVLSDKLENEGLLVLDAKGEEIDDERRGRRTGLTREQLISRMAGRVTRRAFGLSSSRRKSIKTRLV